MRKAEGYWRLAAAMGEIVRKRVRWATGSWTGDVLAEVWSGGVRGDAVGYGSTLGIGDGSTLVGVTTLGGGTTI